MKISFDFDDTLCREPDYWEEDFQEPIRHIVDVLESYHALGLECIIITARSPALINKHEINTFLIDHGLNHKVKDVIYTDHELKGPIAFKLGVVLHYDDKVEHILSCHEYGIRTVKV